MFQSTKNAQNLPEAVFLKDDIYAEVSARESQKRESQNIPYHLKVPYLCIHFHDRGD